MSDEEFTQLSAIYNALPSEIIKETDATKIAEMNKDLKEIGELLLPEFMRRYGKAVVSANN